MAPWTEAALSTPECGAAAAAGESTPSNFGPAEADEVWAEFRQAWEIGDLSAVAAAWSKMTPQTRKWAANAWSMAALMRALQADENTFDGRRWAGRR